jgi:Domain of unknown function (DUF5666)
MQEAYMHKNMIGAMVIGLALSSFSLAHFAAAQNPQGDSQASSRPLEMGGAGDRTFGTLTSVGVDRFELKKMDGGSQTVMVDDQTRYREGARNAEIGLEDLKPGDRVMIAGRLNDHKEFVATVVRRMTAEEVGRFQNAGDRAFGEIISIEGNELKVRNPFQGDKLVVVSDQTTFMKDGQPIALKDLKVGDRIAAMGKETNGRLEAERVFTVQFQRGGGRRSGSGERPPENP